LTPAELRATGYDLVPEGEGERILPAAIVQEFTLSSSGAYELATAESTKPVAHIVRHAGIVKVLRYTFTMESPRQATSALRGKPEMLGSVRGFSGFDPKPTLRRCCRRRGAGSKINS